LWRARPRLTCEGSKRRVHTRARRAQVVNDCLVVLRELCVAVPGALRHLPAAGEEAAPLVPTLLRLMRCKKAFGNAVPGGVAHTAPSKYHDEIISLVFIHTKYGGPIVIMVFRCAMQKVLCLTPPRGASPRGPPACFYTRRGRAGSRDLTLGPRSACWRRCWRRGGSRCRWAAWMGWRVCSPGARPAVLGYPLVSLFWRWYDVIRSAELLRQPARPRARLLLPRPRAHGAPPPPARSPS
jgi:hypothetical protein